MSYIYALYFIEQNAVKIGKANNLIDRLSTLVSTWGNIDPNRAYAFEIDEKLVIGKEIQLHNKYKHLQKTMPKADGSTEFFEPTILNLLSEDFTPISKTLVINKVNQTYKQTPKTYTTLTLNFSPEEKKQIFTMYKSNTNIKNALLDNIQVQLTSDDLTSLQSYENNKQIIELKRENIELKRQLEILRENNCQKKRKLDYQKLRTKWALKETKYYKDKLHNIKSKTFNEDNDNMIKQNLKQTIDTLRSELKDIKYQKEHYQNSMTFSNKHLRTARRIMNKTSTLLSKTKNNKPSKQLVSEIEEFLKDIELI